MRRNEKKKKKKEKKTIQAFGLDCEKRKKKKKQKIEKITPDFFIRSFLKGCSDEILRC